MRFCLIECNDYDVRFGGICRAFERRCVGSEYGGYCIGYSHKIKF
jgi:hypothetical protein